MHRSGSRRFTSRLLHLALGSTLIPNVSVASDDPHRVEVTWSAPELCPSQAWVRTRTEEFLGRPLQEAARDDVTVQAAIVAEDGLFHAKIALTIGAARQPRDLQDPDCVVVADATAFVIASAVDPGVDYADAPPPPPSDSPVEISPAAGAVEPMASDSAAETSQADARESLGPKPRKIEPKAPPVTASQDAAPIEPRWAVGARAGMIQGPLPELSAQTGIGAELVYGRLRTALVANWVLPQESIRPNRGGGHFHLLNLVGDACWLLVKTNWELPLCLRAASGALIGDGRRLTHPQTSVLPWVAVGGSGSVAFALTEQLTLRLEGAVLGAVVQPRFSVVSETATHRADALTLSADLAVEWRFQ